MTFRKALSRLLYHAGERGMFRVWWSVVLSGLILHSCGVYWWTGVVTCWTAVAAAAVLLAAVRISRIAPHRG